MTNETLAKATSLNTDIADLNNRIANANIVANNPNAAAFQVEQQAVTLFRVLTPQEQNALFMTMRALVKQQRDEKTALLADL